jgi:hypothetical protein
MKTTALEHTDRLAVYDRAGRVSCPLWDHGQERTDGPYRKGSNMIAQKMPVEERSRGSDRPVPLGDYTTLPSTCSAYAPIALLPSLRSSQSRPFPAHGTPDAGGKRRRSERDQKRGGQTSRASASPPPPPRTSRANPAPGVLDDKLSRRATHGQPSPTSQPRAQIRSGTHARRWPRPPPPRAAARALRRASKERREGTERGPSPRRKTGERSLHYHDHDHHHRSNHHELCLPHPGALRDREPGRPYSPTALPNPWLPTACSSPLFSFPLHPRPLGCEWMGRGRREGGSHAADSTPAHSTSRAGRRRRVSG